ncbi:metal-sulfur cluster assembly factor [Thermoflexus sp.]|uniref:metal-sulfur cluster assembly factor n=1 Tax=Thermoflexus sp. TaxID=1969742 RepID=UPI0035E45228
MSGTIPDATSPSAPQESQEELIQRIRESLRSVVDPEIGMNVVQLGLIRNIEIQPDLVQITMILTTPFCPAGPYLLEQVRYVTEQVTGRPTKVILGMEMWDPSMMEEDALAEWGLW